MRTHLLEELPGVGPAFAEALRHRGLVRVEDALRVDRAWLRSWLGVERGDWLHDRMRGIDHAPVREHEPRKSVSSERTFARDLHEDHTLERQLLRLCVSVTSALRDAEARTCSITVKVRDPDFTTRQSSHTLPDPVETEHAVYAVALPLLHELRRRQRAGVRLLGVALSGLVERDVPAQLGLFAGVDEVESDRDRALARVVDDLRNRFGRSAVLPGRVLER